MYIMDSDHYAIEFVTYLLVLVVYFHELIIYMLLAEKLYIQQHFFLSVFKT